MAITQLSPGVQVNEIDLTNVVPSAASSIGAYVGDFTWGPLEEIVTVAREKDLTSKFGKPTKLKAVDFTAASLYLKYTDHIEVVRMATDSARNATADTVSGGRLIKNEDHYDGLTGFLSDNPIVTSLATQNSLSGATTITVDNVDLFTGGDIVSGTNIAAGTTITNIDRINKIVTLSQPLVGDVQVVSFTNEVVEVYENKTIASFFAAGSSRLQLVDGNVEYQVGATVTHDYGTGTSGSFADDTVLYTGAAEFAVGELLTVAASGANGAITAVDGLGGKLTWEVVPGAGAGIVDGAETLTAPDTDVVIVKAHVYKDVLTVSGTSSTDSEAVHFTVGDTVSGSVSGASGKVTGLDTSTHTVSVEFSSGASFQATDVLVSPSKNIVNDVLSIKETVQLGVGEGVNFAVNDFVVGSISSATGIVTAVNVDELVIGSNTTGVKFVAGDVLTSPATTLSGTIAAHLDQLVQLGIGQTVNFTVGDTVTGSISGNAGVVTVVDGIGHVLTVTGAALFSLSDKFLVPEEATVSAVKEYVIADIRSISNGAVYLSNSLTNNVANTDSVIVTQKCEVAVAPAIGAFGIDVRDSSHIEIGDELVEVGMPAGTKVSSIQYHNVFALGAGESANFAVGDSIAAPAGSNATGTVVSVDTVANEIGIIPAVGSVAFVAGDVLDVTAGGTVATAAGTLGAFRVPVRYQEARPATLSLSLAVTDAIPSGTPLINRRVVKLDVKSTPKEEYFVVDSLSGISVSDDVDINYVLPEIKPGTNVIGIDVANKAIKLNQRVNNFVSHGVLVKISNRTQLKEDAKAQATSIFVKDTSSIAAGDRIDDIVDPLDGNALQFNTRVVSVNAETGEVVLDTPLQGTIPVAVSVGDTITIDVNRGPWYAKYAGVIGNSLRVEMCSDSASFATWGYKGYFTSAPSTSDYTAQRGGSNDELHIAVIDEDGKFSGSPGTVLETFAFVSQASDARLADGTNNYYAEVINKRSAYLWWGDHVAALPQAGQQAEGLAFTQLSSIVGTSFTEGADSDTIGLAEWSVGYELFRDVETIVVDLMMQPSIPNTLDGITLQKLLIDICEFRTDCIALLSPPVALTAYGAINPVSDVIAWFDQISSSSYAVFDSSSVKVYDKFNDQYLWLPASSSIAGVCAHTDDVAQPWYSPAGYARGQLKGVVKLGHIPRKTDRDQLYAARVNPLATFPGEGTVLYGDKTALSKPSAFDRINVRRLFITLERSISNAAKYLLFEFNDAETRALFVSMVEPFLRNVQGLRGIQDFQVVCDETNNTDQIIDTNQFVGDIYIKPNRSINFITLNFIAVRTGVSFSEIATGVYGSEG